MTKYLFFLIVPFLFFSVGCDTLVYVEETQLDSDLFGNWWNSTSHITMTLSSNGNFVWDDDYSSGENDISNSGIWWVDEDHLVLSGDSWGRTDFYDVSGNTLYFDGLTWEQL